MSIATSPAPASSESAYGGLELLIDGQWHGTEGRQSRPVINPSTGREIGRLPVATTEDLDAAVAAATRAFPVWRGTAPEHRANILHRAAALLRERVEEIARPMTLEEGKPIRESRGEVLFTAGIMDFLAGEAMQTSGKVVPGAVPGGATLVLSEPVGPVAAFSPWNYPLTVPTRKIAAALAAGCTMVIKPAEEAPTSGLAVARALVDAGLPAGVLNVVFGDPAHISERLITSPQIRMVSFTGSTGVGKHIASLAAAGAKPCMLELGGHAPVLVFDDVDVDAVVAQLVGSKFHNNGQSCGSPCRFYVQDAIYDRFVERFAELTSRIRVGDPMEESTQLGPLISDRRIRAMEHLIQDAVEHGARIVAGGEAVPGDGYWWQPTALADVPEDAVIMNEEPFGPVAAISRFSTEEEVVERANRLPYGLGSYLFTSSLPRALRLPALIEAGMVSVNACNLGGVDTFFGGVKESGYGSEGGPEAVAAFLRPKLVTYAA
ncbi:NAD-dependent succinate-semialdehyde dehydrogenase [Naasia sp. SYSU D00948]|uniref:NAD-dependent succinate-semialdehyde dehydrogenase n=1 Tax=Naasia sp. SYSU D00948 TaxID=2817379 RepID=UPI001B30164D|nr:NAD-dependent succinate-semialdehyde dehydrogenase [Naasia sp. SYSU D00948]